MRIRSFVLSVLLLPLAFAGVEAQGWILPRPCLQVPKDDGRSLRQCPPVAATIARTASDVRVRLDDRVLRYEVEERFVNRGGTVGEADYLFPLPKGAAFQDLKLSIDGQLVAGETMNANDARRVYEDIVRRQRDPALVEWMGHGLLRARIFPINPGEEKRVIVRFDAVAEREGDAMRVDYFRGGNPATGGRPVQWASGTGEERTRTSFVLTYGEASSYGTPYSPTHSLDVSSIGEGRRRVDVRGDARDVTVLFPIRRSGAPSITALAHAPGNEDGFALLTLSPPSTLGRDATARDVTFVLDVSGSMSGRKLEQAKAAGRQLLETLRARDRFRLVDFSTDVRTFRDEFVVATPENLRAASRYLDALEATGSTNIAGALAEALRTPRGETIDREGDRPRADDDASRLSLVLFVTDGEATIGERNPDAIASMAARMRDERRVFTFGLGSDVNVSLLERLALEGHGTAQFVRPDESVERMVGIVASRLVDPVLTDVRVRVESQDGGNVRLSKMLPSQPLDIFAGQDLVVMARYSGSGDARLVFEGQRRGQRVTWMSRITLPERERDNAFVARLWATQRVGYLSAEKRKNGGSSELDAEIRTLGERFGIPTEFTSYLVLEPGMVAARRQAMGNVAASSVAPAPQAADRAFGAAKAASEQRRMTSIAALDSSVVAMPMTESVVAGASAQSSRGAAGRTGRADAGAIQRVDARTFEMRSGVWTDVRYRDEMRTVRVAPFSKTYFALLDKLPDLRAVFALGDSVVVVGRSGAIRLDANASDLADRELAELISRW